MPLHLWWVAVTLTWFGAFSHRAVVHLVLKLGPVVVHVDDIDVQIDWILHLVAIHVYCMSSQLHREREREKRERERERRERERDGIISTQRWIRARMNNPNVSEPTTGRWLDWCKTLQSVWTGTNSAHGTTLTLLIGNFIELANVLFLVCQRGMSILLVSWHGPQQHRQGQSSEMFQTHKQHLFCC